MVKRARAAASASPPSKKRHLEAPLGIRGVASHDAAAAADADPPLRILLRTLESVQTESPKIGDAVAYWMRMEDMRSESTLLSVPSLLLICSQSATTVHSHRPLPGRSKIASHLLSFLS